MTDEPSDLIHSDPEILSGTPVFRGTRVPARSLIDHLAHGATIDDFLDGFPSVSRDQAVAVLNQANEMLVAHAHPA